MIAEDVKAIRRALHQIPELGFDERATSAALRGYLSGVGTPRGIAETGLILDLGPRNASKTLLLRADMDGLPIAEETGLPYASKNPGHMHACGHDGHMAALIVAGRALSATPLGDLRVRLLFQPAEEGAGGAQRCLDEGATEGVDAVFGIHLWNELPVGTVAATAGGIMAGVVEVGFTIDGRGGHGAMPHQTLDPVVAGAQLINALQTVVSRRISPLEPAVVTIGAFHAGGAFNVIPDTAELRGTVRTFSVPQQDAVEAHIRQIAAGIAAATGTKIEVHWRLDCVPTVNDPRWAAVAASVAATVPGVTEVLSHYRTMAGEDFGDILSAVPGAYLLVGSGRADGTSEPHHSPRFEIDEAALSIAVGLHEGMARRAAQGWPIP